MGELLHWSWKSLTQTSAAYSTCWSARARTFLECKVRAKSDWNRLDGEFNSLVTVVICQIYQRIILWQQMCKYMFNTLTGWWFGTFGLFFHRLGMSSSQLTFIFFRGVGIPATRMCKYFHHCSLLLPNTTAGGHLVSYDGTSGGLDAVHKNGTLASDIWRLPAPTSHVWFGTTHTSHAIPFFA